MLTGPVANPRNVSPEPVDATVADGTSLPSIRVDPLLRSELDSAACRLFPDSLAAFQADEHLSGVFT